MRGRRRRQRKLFAAPFGANAMAGWQASRALEEPAVYGVSATDAARDLEVPAEYVQHVYEDIDRKRRVAEYLHAAPVSLGG